MAPKLHFVAIGTHEGQAAAEELRNRYGDVGPNEADIVVALGGDGYMLQTLHAFLGQNKPIYGMNLGSVGFLLNDYRVDDLLERLKVAERAEVNPLRMRATTAEQCLEARAFNEVSLLRETRQATKLRILIDGVVRIDNLICDGVLVSTPVGSTAYNLSAHGPILPIDSALLALTPISAFRPRRWHGALLPRRSHVRFEVLETEKRPVSAVADGQEVREVLTVDVEEDRSVSMHMLFDKGRNLDERILAEQFMD